jgi:large subunit ribosomal protein L6
MSRLGKKPIKITDKIEVLENDSELAIKGPKGELKLTLKGNMKLDISSDEISISRPDDKRSSKELHGLYRTLILNMVLGVSEGFKTNMELHGIGYRAQQKGNNLELSLGYSHPVAFEVPEGVSVKLEGQTKIEFSSIDKQLLGETCAKLKKLRKRDAYKGKGIYFAGEVIKKKPGKSVKK